MKKVMIFALSVMVLISSLCGCSQKVLDVNIEGGMDTASKATESYYTAMSNQDFDTLISVSASLNKTCVQNTVAGFDEEKYNKGIETMKTELKKDMENVTVTATIGKETTYDSASKEFKSFIKEFKSVCAGIEKIQSYSKVALTLKFIENANEFTEEIEQNCIQIQDKWFVFDYSTDESKANSETKDEDVDVDIVGGGTSVDDVVSKYFKAISEKNAKNMADVLITMNKTALLAVSGGFDEAEHAKGLDAMKTEMAADPDKATLTPTVTENKTYEENDEEFKTFLATNSAILSRTKQIKAYSVATVSLNISVPGETETFTATETITCVKVDTSWFVMVTE